MKAKMSLDLNSLKQWLVEHFEKMLFGVVVLVFALLAYTAVTRGGLPWGPPELAADAKRAEGQIQDAHNINTKMPKAKPYNEMVNVQKVLEDGYRIPVLLPGSPLDTGLVRRSTPKLFPVRDLQVAGGQGKFAMSDEEEIAQTPMMGDMMGAGTMTGQFKGQRWAVVTALIDYKKQRDAYEAAFQESAFQSPNDWPQPTYYYVERAEVDPENPSAEPKWVRLNTRQAMDAMAYWHSAVPEVVDPSFIPPPTPDGIELAFPLGPLQDRMWGSEVAHLPEITLLEADAAMFGGPMAESTMGYPGVQGTLGKSARDQKKAEKGGEPDPAAEEVVQSPAAKAREAMRKAAEKRMKLLKALQANAPDAPSSPSAPLGSGAMSGMGTPMGMGTRMARPSVGYGGMSGSSSGGMSSGPRSGGMSSGPRSGGMDSGPRSGGMDSGPRSGGSGGMPSGNSYGGASRPSMGFGAAGYGEGALMEELESELLLFRFFDFKVEEGKHYRYRVQLVLANPNYGVNPQYLEKDDLGVQPFLNTVWSDPSPVVAIPRDSRALVVSAKGPSATLMLVHFNYEDGEVAFEEFSSIQRGQLLNARNREFAGAPTGIMPPTDVMSPYGARAEEKTIVDYATEMVFLDAEGGRSLPGRDRSISEPALAFFLNADGNLLVCSELDDQPEVARHKPPEPTGPQGGFGATAIPYGPEMPLNDAGGKKKKGAGFPRGGGRGGGFSNPIDSGGPRSGPGEGPHSGGAPSGSSGGAPGGGYMPPRGSGRPGGR